MVALKTQQKKIHKNADGISLLENETKIIRHLKNYNKETNTNEQKLCCAGVHCASEDVS